MSWEAIWKTTEALIRRKYEVKSTIILIGDIRIDTVRRVVSRKNNVIPLPPREYAILEFLAMSRGKLITRSQIEEHIYDENADLMSNVVDAAICSIRKQIDESGKPSLIKTRRGMGYIIE